MHLLNTKFVTLFLTILLCGAIKEKKHPLHVSTTEVNFNKKDKTLEISSKIFTDDFEAVLVKLYKQKTDLSSAALKPSMNELVKRYLLSHLRIKANGKIVPINYVGFEIDNEATNIYLEVEKISTVTSIEVTNTILYDMFDDQMSIVHIIKDGNRKSTKIEYPEKTFLANF